MVIDLSNVTPFNKLLLNSYFKNLVVELYVLYVLNMNACQFLWQSDIIYHVIHKFIFYELFETTKTWI